MGELSLVRGETTPPLIEEPVGNVLRMAAYTWPRAQALVSRAQRIRWTYAELDRRVDEIAAGLLSLGLLPGERVGIWAHNCAEWVLMQFATARVGLILVNINPAYRTAELEYTLNAVGVSALVCARSFKTSDYVSMLESLAPELNGSRPGELCAKRLPRLRLAILICDDGKVPSGWLSFARIGVNDLSGLRAAEVGVKPRDATNIQFTSGTTGLPKGATLSHRNIVNNSFFVGRSMGLREGDRLCIPVPLYHCFGMVMSNLACVVHGATMVYSSPSFDPLAVLETVQEERCTALHGVPTMFIAELEHPRFAEFNLRSLRRGIMAGAPCPIELMRRVVDRMHMSEITIAYGMTETSPVSFQSSTDDSLERRVTTVGRVQPHLECKLVDPDDRMLPRGAIGELCTRGYSVMLGYWGQPEQTAEVLDADGWMHTGDLAVFDELGYANIVGRSKDLIIRGGENIYPREVEEYLFEHPAIAEVAVFGVPDQRYGESVCAWIKLRDGRTCTAEEIQTYCRERIAHYKVPRHIEFVGSFPVTVTGKIQKFVMREQMTRTLGLAEQQTA